MTNESTEAVLELCLQTQHENTKRAILLAVKNCKKPRDWDRMPSSVRLEMNWMIDRLISTIDELKLEDTKCAEMD